MIETSNQVIVTECSHMDEDHSNMKHITGILSKKPRDRTEHDILDIMPYALNIDIFADEESTLTQT